MSAVPLIDYVVAGAACIVIGASAGVCYSIVSPCYDKTEDEGSAAEDTTIVQARKKKRRANKFEASVRKSAFETVKKSAVPLNILQFKSRYFTDSDHVLLAHLMIDPKHRIERLVFDFAEMELASKEAPPKFKRLAVDRKAIEKFRILSLIDAEVVEIYLSEHIALENKSKGNKPPTDITPHLIKAEVVLVVKRPRKEIEEPSDEILRLRTLLEPYFRDTSVPSEDIVSSSTIVDLKSTFVDYLKGAHSEASPPP